MPSHPTTPIDRVARMLREGTRLMALYPGQISIDVTPDIVALLDQFESGMEEPKLLKPNHRTEAKDSSRNEVTGSFLPIA